MTRNMLLACTLLAAALAVALVVRNHDSHPASEAPRGAAKSPSHAPRGQSRAPGPRPAGRAPRDRTAGTESAFSLEDLRTFSPRDWDAFFSTRTAQGSAVPASLQKEIVTLASELPSLNAPEALVYREAINALLNEPAEPVPRIPEFSLR